MMQKMINCTNHSLESYRYRLVSDTVRNNIIIIHRNPEESKNIMDLKMDEETKTKMMQYGFITAMTWIRNHPKFLQ